MTRALYRHSLDSEFPVAVQGDGVYLVDAAGKRYLDGSGGAAVSCLGHSNTRVREAIKAQIDALAFSHTRFFSNEPMEQLAEDLIADAPVGLTKAWFTCGGSESVEAALKMSRQYFMDRHPSVVTCRRMQSYHARPGAYRRRHIGRVKFRSAVTGCDPTFLSVLRSRHRADETDVQLSALATISSENSDGLTASLRSSPNVVGSTLGASPRAATSSAYARSASLWRVRYAMK